MVEPESVDIAVVFTDRSGVEAVRAAVDDPESEVQVAETRSLDGSAAEWVVLVAAAGPALRAVLDTVIRYIELGRVARYKVGDVEVERPQPSDIELMRKLAADRGRDDAAR
jgi:UDP-3-O-acyl-N-acetylglucosamine deacetylase